MKRNINTVLSFKKYIKRLFLISLLFLFITNCYSQANLPKGAKLKTIKYSDYNISGYVYKKQFVENQKLTLFTSTNSYHTNDTILSGKYFCTDDGNSYIDGMKKTRTYNSISRTKGIFKVTNTKNGIGISANRKEGQKLEILCEDHIYYQIDRNNYSNNNYSNNNDNSTFILQKLQDNKLSLKIKYETLILETIIPHSIDPEIKYDFHQDILDSDKVKLSYKNGDDFIGLVKKTHCYNNDQWAPKNGEYRYASGEVSTGVFGCNSYFKRLYLEEGATEFTDGSIGNGDWLFQQNLTNSEQERIYSKNRSPTEMRNMAKSIIEEKDKKLRAEKTAREQIEKEKLQQQESYRNKLVKKYGEYYGNKISERELVLGMSQEMVNEYWPKKYFSISNINRNNSKTVIWEFDKNKMQREIIKEGKENGNEEGALAVILMLNLSGQLGGLDAPKMLVFKNNKLTDIYRF